MSASEIKLEMAVEATKLNGNEHSEHQQDKR